MEDYVIEKNADGSVTIKGSLYSDLEDLDYDNGFETVLSAADIQMIVEVGEFMATKSLYETSFFHYVKSGKVDEDTGEIDPMYGYNHDGYAETSNGGYVVVSGSSFQLMLTLEWHAEDLRSDTISISEII